jgi:hypothetical protein
MWLVRACAKTRVAELDARYLLAREPHHLSQLLTDDVLRIISKPQRCVVPGLIKTGFKRPAADAINAASTEAEVPLYCVVKLKDTALRQHQR